jgi:hypothetical protein
MQLQAVNWQWQCLMFTSSSVELPHSPLFAPAPAHSAEDGEVRGDSTYSLVFAVSDAGAQRLHAA